MADIRIEFSRIADNTIKRISWWLRGDHVSDWLAYHRVPISSTLIVCAAILALRKPDQVTRPQFWAEDGFFYQQHFLHGWHCLVEPYNGYLHTIPRLIAGISWWIDPSLAPAWFVICAFAATLYTASLALSSRQPFRPRPVLALAVVLVPDAYEILLNVTNLQWVLAGAFILLLIEADPATWPERVHDVVAMVLIGLTGPFSILLAPFFLVRALQRKTAWSWILVGIVALLSAIQSGFILHFVQPKQSGVVEWSNGITAVGMRVTGSLFAGIFLKSTLAFPFRFVFAAAGIAIILGIAVRNDPYRRERTAMAGALFVLIFAGIYRCRWVLPSLNNAGYGSRYFFPVQMVFLWLLASALSDKSHRHWFAASLLTVAIAVNLPRMREPAFVDFHWADYSRQIRDGDAVVIPINPAGWSISLPARPKPLGSPK